MSGFENTVVGPFLATLSSSPQMLRQILLTNGEASPGRMSVDFFTKSFVHFKQLRSLELSDAVFMTDFSSTLWEVLGTLPSLENLTLVANNPPSHPAHAPKHPNNQRYFVALESLYITSSFFLIQHLLGFIDSSCLKSIRLCPLIHLVHNDSERDYDPGDLLTPCMTIVASKWSQSLKRLTIASFGIRHQNSKFLTPLADLREIQTFRLEGWRMEKNNDALRRLAMSWPKLRTLELLKCLSLVNDNETFISLSNLRIIAENCPELRELRIELDVNTIPPLDDICSKSLCHKLDVLKLIEVHQSITQVSLECQIQIARHLDLNFPYLKTLKVPTGNWSGIRDLVKLCQDARRGH